MRRFCQITRHAQNKTRYGQRNKNEKNLKRKNSSQWKKKDGTADETKMRLTVSEFPE